MMLNNQLSLYTATVTEEIGYSLFTRLSQLCDTTLALILAICRENTCMKQSILETRPCPPATLGNHQSFLLYHCFPWTFLCIVLEVFGSNTEKRVQTFQHTFCNSRRRAYFEKAELKVLCNILRRALNLKSHCRDLDDITDAEHRNLLLLSLPPASHPSYYRRSKDLTESKRLPRALTASRNPESE